MNLVGFSERAKASFAPNFRCFFRLSNLNFLEETRDNSDMAKTPFNNTSKRIIRISTGRKRD
jgi:hypothetical protein